MIRLNLTVYGTSQPKGSTRSFVKNGRAITTSDNPNLAAWSSLVASEAQRVHLGNPLLEGALTLAVTFYLQRPKSAPKARRYPTTKPDLDKLVRAISDPLIGSWITDDARIVDVVARKRYGDPPRVEIALWEIDPCR